VVILHFVDMDLNARKACYKQGTTTDASKHRRHKAMAKQKAGRESRRLELLKRIADGVDDASDEPSCRDDAAPSPATGSGTAAALPIPAAPLLSTLLTPSAAAQARIARANKAEANQLTLPEWLVSFPTDEPLSGGNWTVVPRPAGLQCLVIAKKDFTIARDSEGVILAKFSSALHSGSVSSSDAYQHSNEDYYHRPDGLDGSSSDGAGMSGTVILDCIFNEDSASFFVIDCLLWGTATVDWPHRERRFWLSSFLSSAIRPVSITTGAASGPMITSLPSFSSSATSIPASSTAARGSPKRVLHHGLKQSHNNSVLSGSLGPSLPAVGSSSSFSFQLATGFPCDFDGLKQAYSMAKGSSTLGSVGLFDGLLFYLNDAPYEPGPTLNVLRWRDEADSLSASSKLTCVLEALPTGALVTRGFRGVGSSSAASLLLGTTNVGASDSDPAPTAAELAMLTAEDVSSFGITPGDLVTVQGDYIVLSKDGDSSSNYHGSDHVPPPLPGAAAVSSASSSSSIPRRSDSIEMRSNSGGMGSPSHSALPNSTTEDPLKKCYYLVNPKVVGKVTDRRSTHPDLLSELLFASMQAKGQAPTIAAIAAAVAK
jgi:hypothetical protein